MWKLLSDFLLFAIYWRATVEKKGILAMQIEWKIAKKKKKKIAHDALNIIYLKRNAK